MREKSDFFQKKISNARSFRRKDHHNTIWVRVVISILAMIGVFRFFKVTSHTPEEEKEENPLSLGEVIALRGDLKADGDIITHTHTLTTETYGIVALKSKIINLGEYEGQVEITGTIEKIYQKRPIIEVMAISGNYVGENANKNAEIVLNDTKGEYWASAGIYFLPSFFEDYLLMNSGENGDIQVYNTVTDQTIPIYYFRCNASDPNRNCKGLRESISENSSRSFITSNGDHYYKEMESNSRFISNGDRWGVFIHDVPEEEVMQLKDHIVFVNEKIMKNRLDLSASRICQDDEEALQKITNSTYQLKQEGLIVTIEGEGMTQNLICEIQVDFSLPKKGKLLSITKNGEKLVKSTPSTDTPKEIEKKTDDKQISTVTNTGESSIESGEGIHKTWDPTVKQFPINLDKTLQYTSNNRNYKAIFPTSNVSYVVNTVKEKFGRTDITCNFVINVVSYKQKEEVETNPDIRIYECGENNEIQASDLGENYVIKQGAGKTFIAQINNPAWIDFANNLDFQPVIID